MVDCSHQSQHLDDYSRNTFRTVPAWLPSIKQRHCHLDLASLDDDWTVDLRLHSAVPDLAVFYLHCLMERCKAYCLPNCVTHAFADSMRLCSCYLTWACWHVSVGTFQLAEMILISEAAMNSHYLIAYFGDVNGDDSSHRVDCRMKATVRCACALAILCLTRRSFADRCHS